MQVSMIKVFATEMAWEVVDHAMQSFGAMGMTKELPLQLMANDVRADADLRRAERGASQGDRAGPAGTQALRGRARGAESAPLDGCGAG